MTPPATTSPASPTTADAVQAAAEAVAAASSQEVPFSLKLSDDQKDVRDWVHGFAADVVRPAAHEWDEREETPWPIIQEAAKIGLYGFEGVAQFFADPTGLSLPIVNEELFWGDAGIGMSIMGTTLAVAAIFGQGTGEQIGEWIPRCFGTQDDVKVAAFCASEPNAGSDISGVRTTAKFDEAKNEWVINGQKAWATNGGIADVHVIDRVRRPRARLARPRRVRRADERSQGHLPGHARSQSTACARRTPPTCSSTTAASRRGLRARRQGEARRAPGARARGQEEQAPRPRCRPSSRRVRRSAPRRSASRARPMSTRSSTPRSASSSAARSSRTRRSRSRSRA